MTRSELLKKMPELDYTAFSDQAPGGGEISHTEALTMIGDYTRFKADHGLADQTISVGFDSERLIAWMLKHRDKINEVKVFFSIDEDGKFVVVFWPYQKGLPAVPDENDQSAQALSTYDIGNRQPFIRNNNES